MHGWHNTERERKARCTRKHWRERSSERHHTAHSTTHPPPPTLPPHPHPTPANVHGGRLLGVLKLLPQVLHVLELGLLQDLE